MNPDTVHYLNIFLGAGAILLQIFSVVVILVLFFGSKKNNFLDFINKHFLPIGFFIALFASLFSLVYSEIINFAPCYLCWFQRVFVFPQVFLFGTTLWSKFTRSTAHHNAGGDKQVIKYALPLLCFGFVVSVYQNFIYYFGETSTAPCDSSGVSCYKHLISEFGGYISIPMLALTTFVSLIAILLVGHFYGKEKA